MAGLPDCSIRGHGQRSRAAVQTAAPVFHLVAGQARGGGLSPALAESGAVDQLMQAGSLQREVKEAADRAGHAESRVAALDQFERVIAADRAFAQDPVEPAAAAAVLHYQRQLGELLVLAEAIAGRTGLADLQQRSAPAKDVADAYLAFQQAEAAEILAKPRRLPGALRVMSAPGRVVLARIVVQRALRAAVKARVGLFVPGQS